MKNREDCSPEKNISGHGQMDKFLEFYNFDETEIKELINQIFKGERWVEAFLADTHHGFTHGNQVELSCLKLAEKLNSLEKEKLLQEGRDICEDNSYECAMAAIRIAAIFHDCGRFNKDGEIIVEEQKRHQILSSERAEIFCERVGLNKIVPYVREAILCHDFQNRKLTPYLDPPETIIGKVVQSSDQMGWFHPDSVERTLNYGKAVGRPFYDPNLSLEERLNWKMHMAKDSLTVLLSQLFGSTEIDRFGIESARLKAESYKAGLEKNILRAAREFNVETEVRELIESFRKTNSKSEN